MTEVRFYEETVAKQGRDLKDPQHDVVLLIETSDKIDGIPRAASRPATDADVQAFPAAYALFQAAKEEEIRLAKEEADAKELVAADEQKLIEDAENNPVLDPAADSDPKTEASTESIPAPGETEEEKKVREANEFNKGPSGSEFDAAKEEADKQADAPNKVEV